MDLQFRKSGFKGTPKIGRSHVELQVDNWDDFSFKTLFKAVIYDHAGSASVLGSVKIGFVGQPHGSTSSQMPNVFEDLPDGYFSLGQDPDYYENLMKLPHELRERYLAGMKDVVANPELRQVVDSEKVYGDSLMRSVSSSAITGQFSRILKGGKTLTEFNFALRVPTESKGSLILTFQVSPESKPPTNIHVLIGRNGVGKTTLLNGIVGTIAKKSSRNEQFAFFAKDSFGLSLEPMPDDYFSSLNSVAFSAFDPFIPPMDQPDRSKGVCYFYTGLKKLARSGTEVTSSLKGHEDLAQDFVKSMLVCFSLVEKREHWKKAIAALESDENFSEMNLTRFADPGLSRSELIERATNMFEKRMSSGHAVVLLTMTKLVETVEEKSLVLMDEPESHLHPPLLSAFIRALSDLLLTRNAVAIVATHSPVIVQEVPSSCVWKIRRYRNEMEADRPELETFAENVGLLTREIFGLEVNKSGFHDLFARAVDRGLSFEAILNDYDGQIGFEGQALLRGLIASRLQR